MAVNIWTAGVISSGIVARQYDETGTAGDTLSGEITTGGAYSVALDTSGNIFLAGTLGISSVNYRVVVYDSSLTQQYKITHSDAGRGIAARPGMGCYVNFIAPYNSYQFDGSGSEVWSKYHLGNGTGVATDSSDNAYFTHASTGNRVYKYDSSGSQQWYYLHNASVNCVAVDNSGNVYIGGDVYSSVSTRKLNSSGSLQWSVNHGTFVTCIAVDAAGNVYTGGDSYSSVTTRKYNSSGTLQWSANHGATVRGIAVDSAGNVYTVGDLSFLGGTYSMRCYDSSGSLQWSKWHGDTQYGIALIEPGAVDVPALSVPLSMGVPAFTRSHSITAVSVGMGLGVPSFSSPSSPPILDPSRADLIFRLYLSGSTLLELPMRSFQCRRRLGASTWLTVDIPIFTLEKWIDIKSRAGNHLSIYAGYRSDGMENIGSFLESTLTEQQYEITPFSASIRLTARIIPTSFSPTARTLYNVISRGKQSGKKTAKAGLDFLVRPNDTVYDGNSTWTVGAVLWTVSAGEASMIVTEDS